MREISLQIHAKDGDYEKLFGIIRELGLECYIYTSDCDGSKYIIVCDDPYYGIKKIYSDSTPIFIYDMTLSALIKFFEHKVLGEFSYIPDR